MLDHAAVHHGDAVRHGHGLLLVVGHVHGGDAHAVLDLLDGRAHLHAQLGVQVAEGFVHQQHVGLDTQGAGQGHALLLSAGQLGGHAVRQLVDLHQLQKFVRLAVDQLFIDALVRGTVFEAEFHVLAHVHVGENGVVLEHHADIAFGGVQIVDAGVVKVEIAALDGVKARDHAQKRGLAAAAGAQQGKKFAAADAQRQVFDHGGVSVALYGVADADIDTHGNLSFGCSILHIPDQALVAL